MTRTCLLAVLALVASLVWAGTAKADPAGTVGLFTPGPSGTPSYEYPLGQTAAGVAYQDAQGQLWVQPTGGSPAPVTGLGYARMTGDLLSSFDYSSSTFSWRTMADPTIHDVAITPGLTYLTPTPTGYLAMRGTGPYELLNVNVLTGETPTVFGVSSVTGYGIAAGPLGALLPVYGTSSGVQYFYFPYKKNRGTGQLLQTPANAYCNGTLTRAYTYCSWYDAQGELTRVPLTGDAPTTVPVNANSMVPAGNGIAFTSMPNSNDPANRDLALGTWMESSTAPTQRLDSSFHLTGTLAPTTETPTTVLVSRDGPVGQGGIWASPAKGSPTLVVASPAEARGARAVALAPGQVAWQDNNSWDGSVWSRDLTTSGGSVTPGATSLVATGATSTSLSIAAGRLTYTAGASRWGATELNDGGAVQEVAAVGSQAALSGDRLLTQSWQGMNTDNPTQVWTLHDLRTGQSTPLPDAQSYALWGERLARMDSDGSVWVSDLRTGAPAVQLRPASTGYDYVFGTVYLAGDTVGWQITLETITQSGASETTDTATRNLTTMAPAAPIPGLQYLYGLSTGYAEGMNCPANGPCSYYAVSLTTGEATPFSGGQGSAEGLTALDGNVLAYLSSDGIPTVTTLPAYADQPRLLAAPGAGAGYTPDSPWTVRVVASRVLSTCQVQIKDASNTVVRSLDCTDPHAARTVAWDGRDDSGAAVPDGDYTWQIAGAVDGMSLADYDGSSTALSGALTVSGVTTGPTGPTLPVSPAAGATAVPVGSTVTATFPSAVQGVDGTTFTLTDPNGTAVPAVVGYNAKKHVATLNPNTDLAADTVYTATLTGGSTAIRDTSGTPFPTQSWSFTTGPAPTVKSSKPGPNSTAVAPGSTVTATFSEPVQGVSGATFTLTDSHGTAVPATVGYDATSRTATLDPSANLPSDQQFTVTLTGGASAIRDAAGNPLVTKSWTFTTGPAPTVTGKAPAAGATGVPLASTVTATFSEPVVNVGTATVTLTDGSGTAVPASVTYDATTRVASLVPAAPLAPSTTYTVTVTGGGSGITDLAGNPLRTTTWSFTTAAG